MWQLVINGPGYFDTAYDLPEGVTQVGRADENDIVLSGDLVSRKHCRIHVGSGGVVFEDLGSRNGTKLNAEPVTGSVDLSAGDVIGIGDNTLALKRLRQAEVLDTEMVDTGGGGKVRRFGRGIDIEEAVLFAKDVKESSVLKALDNFAPFDIAEPPIGTASARTSDTDETEGKGTGERARTAMQSLVLLYRAAESLARAPSLQTFLDDACDLIMKRVNATTGVVLLKHPSGVMVPAAVRHLQKLSRGEVPVSDGIIEAALTKGQAIAVANVQDDSRFAERESVVLYGVDQVLCIPIGTRAPFAGVLYLNRPRADAEPVEALLDVCTAVSQLLETGIQKFSDTPALLGRSGSLKQSLERLYPPDIAARRFVDLEQSGRLSQSSEVHGTVLCVELVGLPTSAARLPPERFSETLAEWYRVAPALVMSFEGAVDHVSAEGARAFFGFPYARGDDAIRAVRTAMALRGEWEKLSQRRGLKERFGVRAALTTGRAWVGAVALETRFEPLLLGDALTVASLLMRTAEAGQVLITGKTLAHVGARFDVTPLGERLLPGTRNKVAVFEVLDEDSDSGTLSGVR